MAKVKKTAWFIPYRTHFVVWFDSGGLLKLIYTFHVNELNVLMYKVTKVYAHLRKWNEEGNNWCNRNLIHSLRTANYTAAYEFYS